MPEDVPPSPDRTHRRIGRRSFPAIIRFMEPSEKLPPELERFWRTDDGLTACERAETYGIDLSLLDDNLSRSPSERIRQNDSALELIDLLRKGRRDAKS